MVRRPVQMILLMFIASFSFVWLAFVTPPENDADRRAEPNEVRGTPKRGCSVKPARVDTGARHQERRDEHGSCLNR